jgi:hypothetical protein
MAWRGGTDWDHDGSATEGGGGPGIIDGSWEGIWDVDIQVMGMKGGLVGIGNSEAVYGTI